MRMTDWSKDDGPTRNKTRLSKGNDVGLMEDGDSLAIWEEESVAGMIFDDLLKELIDGGVELGRDVKLPTDVVEERMVDDLEIGFIFSW